MIDLRNKYPGLARESHEGWVHVRLCYRLNTKKYQKGYSYRSETVGSPAEARSFFLRHAGAIGGLGSYMHYWVEIGGQMMRLNDFLLEQERNGI